MSLNREQEKIKNYISKCILDKTRCEILIHGPAGTGKSYLIDHIKKFLLENKSHCIVSSHQAISASNINGITLYKLFSFFGNRESATLLLDNTNLKLKKINNDFVLTRTFKTDTIYQERQFSSTILDNWLIIDEISMVGLELIDDIDNILQTTFNNNEVFGGINLILLGDLYQLKPVKETPIYNLNIDHFIKYIKIFHLTINQRQENEEFFQLCHGIKRGVLSSAQKKSLKTRLVKNFDPNIIKDVLHIFPTKNLCDDHNILKLLSLNEENYYFIKAIDTNQREYPLNTEDLKNFFGVPSLLLISNNSKIMLTCNEGKLMNGEIHFIKEIVCDSELNEEDFDKLISLEEKEYYNKLKTYLRVKKKNIFYGLPTNFKIICEDDIEVPIVTKDLEITKKDIAKKIFIRKGFPIQLSWAITTHKIQGLTLSEAVVDLGKNNFDPVQLYINISRVKDFNNLYIKDLKLPLPVSKNKKIIKNFIKDIEKNNLENNKFVFKKEQKPNSNQTNSFEIFLE